MEKKGPEAHLFLCEQDTSVAEHNVCETMLVKLLGLGINLDS